MPVPIPALLALIAVIIYYHLLDCEVRNGGLNQYFYNHGPELAWETLLSLRYIGDNEKADILMEALEAYPQVAEKHNAAHGAGPAQAQLQAFSETYTDSPFDRLDDRYYEARPESHELLAGYIRSHPDEFID